METIYFFCSLLFTGTIGFFMGRFGSDESVVFEYPEQSELSNPKRKKSRVERKLNIELLYDFIVLEQKHGPMCTKFFSRLTPKYSSHGQRLSDLHGAGYLKSERGETEYGIRHIYSFTDKGFDLAFNNK